jgi:hypothetical protein
MEHECFGLPNGGMIVGTIVGVLIILIGLGVFLQDVYGISISVDIWPIIIIIFGVLIVIGALFGRRRYRTSNPT